MEIKNNTPVNKITNTRRKGRVQNADGSFSSFLEGDVEGTAPVVGTSPINAPSAFFSVQEMDVVNPKDLLESNKKRAKEILDNLKKLQMSLIDGAIDQNDLENISKLISEQNKYEIDDELSSILNEIDIRAAVELAKLKKSS